MIGGNVSGIFQRNTGTTKNELGEKVPVWEDIQTLTGWLDLSSGDSKYAYNAKIQESTHTFLTDCVGIDRRADDKRLVINGTAYDVLLIDDPMELHQHLEIYLRFVG